MAIEWPEDDQQKEVVFMEVRDRLREIELKHFGRAERGLGSKVNDNDITYLLIKLSKLLSYAKHGNECYWLEPQDRMCCKCGLSIVLDNEIE